MCVCVNVRACVRANLFVAENNNVLPLHLILVSSVMKFLQLIMKQNNEAETSCTTLALGAHGPRESSENTALQRTIAIDVICQHGANYLSFLPEILAPLRTIQL